MTVQLPELLEPTAVEFFTLPGGTTVEIPKTTPTFPAWTGEPPSDTYGGKPVLDWDGEPVFAELYILRVLEHHGWAGAWIDTFRGRVLGSDGQTITLPTERHDQLVKIYETAGSTSGCFDVYAWTGEDILFAEAKRSGKDQIRDSQVRWLDAALRCGLSVDDLLVLEWTALS